MFIAIAHSLAPNSHSLWLSSKLISLHVYLSKGMVHVVWPVRNVCSRPEPTQKWMTYLTTNNGRWIKWNKTKWRKGRRMDRWETIARISLNPWAHGTDKILPWKCELKYQRETRHAGVRTGEVKGISAVTDSYTHTWVNIAGISRAPVSIRHSNIQKYCKYMHTYIQIY